MTDDTAKTLLPGEVELDLGIPAQPEPASSQDEGGTGVARWTCTRLELTDALRASRDHPDPCTPEEVAEFVLGHLTPVEAPDPAEPDPPVIDGFREFTCGRCGETFGDNCDLDDIRCVECDAVRCPCCKRWFGGLEGGSDE